MVSPFTKRFCGVADDRLVLDEALVLIEVEELAGVSVAAALVIAVMMALAAFWYSALKFCVRTWNSCTAFCGNGLPRLASWPTTPPSITSFL